MFVLIVVTYIGGAAWAPMVSMQEFSSKTRCEDAKAEVLATIDHMNKSNLTFGQPRRELVRAACQPK